MVSFDLDVAQSAHQLAKAKGWLRDERLGRALAGARVRMFVLSPTYTGAGTTPETQAVGSASSSLRLLNLLRRAP